MNNTQNNKGQFEIAREDASLSFDEFCSRYYDLERPVIIKNISEKWSAPSLWTEPYIREKLAKESTAKVASLWYWMERGTLKEDYTTPEVIENLLDSPEVFSRTQIMRIWIHSKGNVSSWHYDANMVNVFNVQVTGQKEWVIVSPDTPLVCYPFLNFSVMGETDEKMLRHKNYAHFKLNEGEMLYIPPLWFHKVTSCKDENISLNWIFTKKKTTVVSKTLTRELERYYFQEYLSNHRFKFIQNGFNKLNSTIPGYLRWKWRYPKMIETLQPKRRFQLTRRVFKELAVLGKVARHATIIQPYIDDLKTVKKL